MAPLRRVARRVVVGTLHRLIVAWLQVCFWIAYALCCVVAAMVTATQACVRVLRGRRVS